MGRGHNGSSRVLEMFHVLIWVMFIYGKIHQIFTFKIYAIHMFMHFILYIYRNANFFKQRKKKHCSLLSAYYVPGEVLST